MLEKILIEADVASTPIAEAVRRNAKDIEILDVPTGTAEESLRRLGLTAGKRVLLLKRFQGRFFKQCQGLKKEYSCCNLHTLAEANGCTMECTYCILQYYMTSPHLSVFANLSDLQGEIERVIHTQPSRIFRIGTGELSDSLLLDPLTESTRHMVPFFRRLPNAVLELKTKTDSVSNLLDLDHGQRTVVSWSVNPAEVGAREELKTAPIVRRLAAARRVAGAGYPVGFHIDPMIHHANWRDGYAELLDKLLDAVEPRQVAWISLGTLRFPPEMKGTMEARFPRSELRYGELVRGDDGKMHYLRPMRIEMYRHVVDGLLRRLEHESSKPVIYLCMEPPDVWKRVFDLPAPSNAALEHHFAENYWRRFGGGSLPEPKLSDYEGFGGCATEREPAQPSFVPISAVSEARFAAGASPGVST